MAKLVLSSGNAIQGEYELDNDQTSIGRKPDNDIQIDSLAVSGKHALVLHLLNDSFVEDLGSTNGTYVNGKLIKKHALKDGDVISIGKHDLKYVNESELLDDDDEEIDDEFEKTLIISPGGMREAAEKQAREAVSSVAGETTAESQKTHDADSKESKVSFGMPLGRLTILNGPIAGKELKLTKALITLGRPGKQVAVVSRRPQGYFLTHIESGGDGKRYPVVNGKPIGVKAHLLKDKDEIELAEIKMEFDILG